MIMVPSSYTAPDYEKYWVYKCSNCGLPNWRTYEGSLQLWCDHCSKMFNIIKAEVEVIKVADEVEKAFKDRIKRFEKAVTPKIIYHYDGFAVFEYWTIMEARDMESFINKYKGLFKGLYTSHCDYDIVFIDEKEALKGEQNESS